MNKSTIKLMLKSYAILVIDNREKTHHIEYFFSKPTDKEVNRRNNTIRTQLKAGDYTFLIMPNDYLGNLQPIMFNDTFLIEKKSGEPWGGGAYAEMKGNLIPSKTNKKSHELFKKEFNYPVKNFHLLLENTESEKDLFKVKRGISNKIYYKIYNTFLQHRNEERQEKRLNPVNVIHCKQMDSGLIVKELILNFVIENIEFIKTLA